MVYKYVQQKKWFWEGMQSLLFVLIGSFLMIYSFSTSTMLVHIPPILNIILILAIVMGIYRTIYCFQLPKKEYLIFENEFLSIYRGNLIPRKKIPFSQVIRIVQANEVIVFILQDGREEQVYLDYLSNDAKLELKEILHQNFPSKTVGL